MTEMSGERNLRVDEKTNKVSEKVVTIGIGMFKNTKNLPLVLERELGVSPMVSNFVAGFIQTKTLDGRSNLERFLQEMLKEQSQTMLLATLIELRDYLDVELKNYATKTKTDSGKSKNLR